MNKLEPGDIYFVEFGPAKGHEYEKLRPAIILSKPDNTTIPNIIICVPLSSKLSNKSPDDIIIKKDPINKLMMDSIIKMRHLTALDPSFRIKKFIGKINPETHQKIRDILRKLFSI